jgi:hypothetical protein
VKIAKIAGCAIAGGISFAIGGVFLGGYMYPNSNMAGIVGFVTAPVGLVIGVIVGIVWTKSGKK